MKRTFLSCLLILLLAGTVVGQKMPIGPAAWQDNTTGEISRAFGPGGEPSLNYQETDSSWVAIINDWEQVGSRRVWKSVHGNHRVFADSTGAAIYAKGNHYLGTKTTHLIKFKRSDSTWQTLKASFPDSVTFAGNLITFHNIFPGVDKRLMNNPKFFQTYMETFIFHQEARDSLATWGPWTGYLLGTATRLSVDSLNLSWRDAAGAFGVDVKGRMTEGWIEAVDVDTAIFVMAGSHLQADTGMIGAIPIHKRLALIGGTPYLVEMFNASATASLPEGDLWHNAHFGNTDAEAVATSIENYQFGGVAQMGAIGGTLDSIVFSSHITIATCTGTRLAIYKWTGAGGSGDDLLDTVPEYSQGAAARHWEQRAVVENTALTADEYYLMLGWAAQGAWGHTMWFENNIEYLGSNANRTYSGGNWSDPLDHTGVEDGTWHVSIYGVYTETAVAGNPRRNREQRQRGEIRDEEMGLYARPASADWRE